MGRKNSHSIYSFFLVALAIALFNPGGIKETVGLL